LQNVLNLFKGKKTFKGKKEKRLTILKVLNFRIKKWKLSQASVAEGGEYP